MRQNTIAKDSKATGRHAARENPRQADATVETQLEACAKLYFDANHSGATRDFDGLMIDNDAGLFGI